MSKKLCLIDGSGYIFRAFYALPPMTRSDGTPVNAVFGFCSMMIRLLGSGNVPCDYMAVVFDAARKNFRNEIYSEYKANRGETPEDLIPQFPLIREAVKAFSIASIEQEGYEADDLIATIAKKAEKEGYEVSVISADKDLMQLMCDGIKVFDPLKNRELTLEDSLAKFGVSPDKILQVQALVGDAIDNIPGVKGVGPKTAAKLIEQFGDIHNMLLHVDEIDKEKLRETIKTSREDILLSEKLARLEDNAQIEINFENLKRVPFTPALGEFFAKNEFRKLAVPGTITPQVSVTIVDKAPTATKYEIKKEEQPSPKSIFTKAKYISITDEKVFDEFLKTLGKNNLFAFDVLQEDGELLGLSLCAASSEAAYVAFSRKTPSADLFEQARECTGISKDVVLKKLEPFFENEQIMKVTLDSKKMRHLLKEQKFANLQDLMLASYSLYGTEKKHSLSAMAEAEFSFTQNDISAFLKEQKKKASELEPEAFAPFAAENSFLIFSLWNKTFAELSNSTLFDIYEKMELPLSKILYEMENVGIRVSEQKLTALNKKFDEEIEVLQKEIWRLAGEEFNINSSQQLGIILFDKLKLPGATRSKVSGNYTTDFEVLETLAAEDVEIAGKLLRYREISKLNSTYAVGLLKAADETQRIHTTFMQALTSTGRLSSTEPNLQNIPVRSEEGRVFRNVFIPTSADFNIISADYSQIELRLMAHVGKVKRLIADFEAGKDIHAITASRVFGVPLENVDKVLRRRAKAINFGIIYGISAFGLAHNLGISRSEAKGYIDAYFAAYPEILTYMEQTKKFAHAHGYVMTPFGRKCHVEGITIPRMRTFAERAAINAPIQGGAADIMKKAMIDVDAAIQKGKISATMMLQIHDELVFEAPAKIAKDEATKIKAIMEKAAKLDVPLIADADVGESWGEAH